MQDEKRFAVLIDADNVSAKYIKYILDEISNYGVATYKRIYGDWTRPNTSSWKDLLLENSITPVQQYGYTVGKNATDSAMIIDAMDILYSGNVEGFCIVSSDSDFTKLASRLRESGMLVVGMGEKKTPKPFIAACNQFKFLDIIAETEQKGDKELNIESKSEESNMDQSNKAESSHDNSSDSDKTMTDINVIKSAVIKMMNEVDEGTQRMNMGELGSRLVKRYPDFDVRNYGDTKLSKFLKKFDFLEITTDGREGSSMWVSLISDKDQDKTIKAPAPRNKPRYKKNYKKKPR
ncbi:MAG TPA: NYN domain-containing protein [Clostridiales bacterium]|nr:NYN domain-containing protein [Clostridiales bacterium]